MNLKSPIAKIFVVGDLFKTHVKQKKMKKLILLFVVLVNSIVFAQTWKLGSNHSVSFSNKDVSGTFSDVSGNISLDENKLGDATLNLKIKVSSINTGNGIQNKHATSDEWFNADKYPYIEFTAKKIEKTENGFKAVGTLQIKNVSKEISIPITFSKKGSKGTMTAKFSVERTDYGVGKKGNDVAETLKIVATIEVQKK